MRYRCIHRRRRQYAIRMMCRVLGVSRSGYYSWCQRGESPRARRSRELLCRVRQVHLESRGVYGARKVHRELIAQGEACGRHKVAQLMHEAGLRGCPKRRFRRLLEHPPSHPPAPNVLDQDFTAERPNERWASDITYVGTSQGTLYLAVVMDLYSRRIIGWSMSRRINRHLALDALRMAELPIVEVHLSNIYQRESYRHHSYVSEAATGVICGLGGQSYMFALDAMAGLIGANS